jgi:DNA replication protein DnaC
MSEALGRLDPAPEAEAPGKVLPISRAGRPAEEGTAGDHAEAMPAAGEAREAGPLVEELKALRLSGMSRALAEQSGSRWELSFEERLADLVATEKAERTRRATKRRLSQAKLRYRGARLEEVDYDAPRNLDAELMAELAWLAWLEEGRDVIITGGTGLGKTYLSCALAHAACLAGKKALYRSLAGALQELEAAKAKGTYTRAWRALERADLLVLDEWALDPLPRESLRLVLELVDARHGRRSTLVASPVAVDHWPRALGVELLGRAVADRLAPGAHRLELAGESLRPRYAG